MTESSKARFKRLRAAFNQRALARAGGLCEGPDCAGKNEPATEVHHITPRKDPRIENDGYAVENAIAVCPDCHLAAEEFYRAGAAACRPEYKPDSLYERIGSSLEEALEACRRLR